MTPASMLVVAGYVVGISVLPSDPDNQLAEVMSMIPTFAPTLMPMRLAMGGVPVWQAVLSVGLVVALIPGADLAVRPHLPQRGHEDREPGQAPRRAARGLSDPEA